MMHLLQHYPLLFEPGDRMTREDFLAQWEQMPRLKSVELIDGMVYMPSPVSMEHGRRDHQMQVLIGAYAARAGNCEALSNATWLMLESAPQPDLALCLLPAHGGRTQVREGFASGSPELVVEITKSSRTYDLGPKLALYQRAAVSEYIAVLLEEQRIEWRKWKDGSFVLLAPDTDGILQSEVFPGLWLNERAFWDGDVSGMLRTLDAGLAAR